MDVMITSNVLINVATLKLLSLLAPDEENSSLSINKDNNGIHLGIQGACLNMYRRRKPDVCETDLPEEYVVSVSMSAIRKYLAANPNSTGLINLSTREFFPRLQLRDRRKPGKVENK